MSNKSHFHFHQSIDGFLALDPKSYTGWLLVDGKPLSYSEAKEIMLELKAKGFEVAPACDNHDERGFCRGHAVEEATK